MNANREKPLKIAIQGYEGSFHQLAAQQYFGDCIEVVPTPSFSKLIQLVAGDTTCKLGVMAIENSIAGSILPNYSLLETAGLSIIGEVYLQIGQHLMALPGETLSSLKEVHSHPMALLQCSDFLQENNHLVAVETIDTAGSAKQISQGQLNGTGAIASELAAQMYGLEIIRHHIETVKNNYTRFLILSKNGGPNPLGDKASIHFNVQHTSGSLSEVLLVLADQKINISKLQSAPVMDRPWEYSFHIDIEFDRLQQYETAIHQVKAHCLQINTLGIYKNGKND